MGGERVKHWLAQGSADTHRVKPHDQHLRETEHTYFNPWSMLASPGNCLLVNWAHASQQ